MTRYQVFAPEAISNPFGYIAFVSSTTELTAFLSRKYPHALWEAEQGVFNSDFTMPFYDQDGDMAIRGIYPFNDEYVHLIIRRVS